MSETRSCAIAVDGGGSKTTVVCHDLTGSILGRSKVGATNPNSVGDEAAYESLRSGVEEVLTLSNRTTRDVVAVCAGMSGVDRPDDKIKVRGWFKKILGPNCSLLEQQHINIFNDGTIALSCGTHGKLYGIVVISGTGTISLGYNSSTSDGELKYFRAAGWGPVLGDEGSGYDIGQRVLRAATFASDGRGPQTTLCDALLEHLKLPNMSALIGWAYDKATFSWQKIAEVAPVAIKCAKEGDIVAREIMEAAADGLLISISAVAKNLGFGKDDDFPIVYAGGILSSGVLAPYLTPKINKVFPNAKIMSPEIEPVMGAVFLTIVQKYWELK